MPLMSVVDFRQHLDTAASDASIQDLLDAEEAAISRVAGPLEEKIEEFYFDDYGNDLLILSNRASSITSINQDDTILAVEDYVLQLDGHVIRRTEEVYLSSSSWGEAVVVTYVPFDNTAERKRVLIFLVKVGLAQSGYEVERNPEWQMTPMQYQETRVKNLRSLRKAFRFA